VATLHFSGTDVKVFTPISSALANLPNGAGTIVVLVRQTTAAGDMAGLLDSTGSTWYHALGVHNAGNGNKLWDDDNTTILGITSQNTSLTDWKLFALDWGAVAGVESFHFRDQTTLGSWTHENSSVNNSVVAGPGTSGWFRMGVGTMTTALLIALVTVAFVVLLDRKDRRHDRHVTRLLEFRHDPARAALADMPTAELLYLRPEDDEAWNEQHRSET
jgi:hypothetical protein